MLSMGTPIRSNSGIRIRALGPAVLSLGVTVPLGGKSKGHWPDGLIRSGIALAHRSRPAILSNDDRPGEIQIYAFPLKGNDLA